MPDLVPHPFGALVTRAFRELDSRRSIFDLPERFFFGGDDGHDFSVAFHGHRPSAPVGPAAGPHTQMAQNLVLAWLGGARVLELKTVQIRDELTIPRPCIDMRTVGYNAEWSQELRLEESLAEYVKGAMLIEMLRATGAVPQREGFDHVVHDMSVGYDLAGIRSERVQAFVHGMRNAAPLVDRLRREIPAELARFRDLAFPAALSDSVTLSTFHGCPPDEIERIMTFLLRDLGLNAIVKLNPMLLGPKDARHLLHDVLGYADLRIPDTAFARDTTWAQAVDFIGRLTDVAAAAGVGFGVKLSNTLIVENTAGFLPASEKEVYLSGPPLHVLAIELVHRLRRTFGGELPISFSAGIDRVNYPDAVALGLVPVTVCTDLLKKGGYRRLAPYHAELAKRMDGVGARDVETFIRRAYGTGPPGETLAAARVRNAERYASAVQEDPRYADPQNRKPPRKIGSRLRGGQRAHRLQLLLRPVLREQHAAVVQSAQRRLVQAAQPRAEISLRAHPRPHVLSRPRGAGPRRRGGAALRAPALLRAVPGRIHAHEVQLGGRRGAPRRVAGGVRRIEHADLPRRDRRGDRHAHALGVRHDLILGEGNSFMRAARRGIEHYLRTNGEDRALPVVNLQCDIDHPTQTLADLCWLKERFPDGLTGRTIAVSWAYSPSYAKPLSVPQGLIMLLTRFGAHVRLAHPPGYDLMAECTEAAAKNAAQHGGSFRTTDSMDDAFEGADVVYPKSWGPYDLMLERVAANRDRDAARMKDIEQRALARNRKHTDWICDERRMQLTRDGKALYMHCLPADIGAEVAETVMERHRVDVAREANKKVYVVMALLAAAKERNLRARLERFVDVSA